MIAIPFIIATIIIIAAIAALGNMGPPTFYTDSQFRDMNIDMWKSMGASQELAENLEDAEGQQEFERLLRKLS